MSRKELGRIQKIRFGMGGYQDAMMGVSFTLGGQSWGVSDFIGTWATAITSGTKWSEADRASEYAKVVYKIAALLKEAKVDDFAALQGQPIEVEFEGNTMKSWRLLTEVL